MMIENLVSTIIPVHNRPQMLRVAVKSVLAQTHRPIEVIIADDGSTDQTPAVARELVEQHPDIVRYIRHENAGPGPARELGRRIARGEFIQYLDSDDRLLPNKFADQIAAFRKRPDCLVAYGITRLVDRNGKVLADPFKWTSREIPELFPGLLVDRWWCTHTPLYRRSLTDQIGPWCDMRWSQDWEYDSRIGSLGTKLVHCGTHVSEHVHHDGVRQTSSASWTTDPTRLRNRVQLMNVLWEGATKAGVPQSAPERQHFARWCFAIGRNCAVQGMRPEALRCFELAEFSAGSAGAGRKGIALYRLLFNTLGSGIIRRIESVVQRVRRRPGAATMEQSFASTSPVK
ncbi:glycosyltransferase family 2 protein [Stieleria sp. ICT_E10.1]|uniref:glycosyltransferase family 2 protein n=1 Tax=Stieleria sedimenti TaxID=2976331 RepID=UPI002180820F|nr:glycosyltransferase family A protein [Stieleria sedimenti]MCS7469433.1 glycosyltransferase family 2 protein [Stieleria sedimenti]